MLIADFPDLLIADFPTNNEVKTNDVIMRMRSFLRKNCSV